MRRVVVGPGELLRQGDRPKGGEARRAQRQPGKADRGSWARGEDGRAG